MTVTIVVFKFCLLLCGGHGDGRLVIFKLKFVFHLLRSSYFEGPICSVLQIACFWAPGACSSQRRRSIFCSSRLEPNFNNLLHLREYAICQSQSQCNCNRIAVDKHAHTQTRPFAYDFPRCNTA